MFVRFGYPPNALGYCGPADVEWLAEIAAGDDGKGELEHAIAAFLGAWPYLQLIGGHAGLMPLDERVVEAYWIGNALLDRVDLLSWGNSLDERFRRRAGGSWDPVSGAVDGGGRPNHAFHVFSVYPWVGLLGGGATEQALDVLEKRRIRWGTVNAVDGTTATVTSRPLVWDGRDLTLGALRQETVDLPIDGTAVSVGDAVAMHWNYVCQPLRRDQLRRLELVTSLHLGLANRERGRLATRVEDA
jgi:hypothetical protein